MTTTDKPASQTNAPHSQGFVHHPTGPVSQQFGDNTHHHYYAPPDPSRPPPPDPAAAAALLAQMPTDALPPHAPLPPHSRITYDCNPLFVGREPDLLHLAATLKGGTEAAVIGQVAAATGLGGIGKTQLAIEFAYRYGQFFGGGVFWLSLADAGAVPAEVVAVGHCLNLPGFDGLSFEAQVQRVRQAWQEPIPRLLIFDNCEEEKLLDEWKPKTGGCRVLVTSRCAEWNPHLTVRVLPLGVLSRPESVELLREMPGGAREDEDETLDAIAAELGDLPLALHLAGSYLHTYRQRVTPLAYLEQIRTPAMLAHRSMVGKHLERDTPNPTGHEWAVERTFALSYDLLDSADTVDALALALLARAAHFAPGEPLPRDLLLEALETHPPRTTPPQQTKSSWFQSLKRLFVGGSSPTPDPQPLIPEDAEDALRRLLALGLLEATTPPPDAQETPPAEPALRMHRLVARFVQQKAADETARDAVEQTMLTTARRLNNAGDPRPLLALQPHLRHTTDVAEQRGDERAASLCNDLGYHLHAIGDYQAARPYFERALEIWERVLGPDHPDTAASLNNLGMLLHDMGQREAARPYLERALEIFERVLGPDHPSTATSLNTLGYLLHDMGQREAARPYSERALEISERVLGPDHPDTASSLNNLGRLLHDMGQLEAARPYYERALEIRERVLGPDHPDTASSLNNLGTLLNDMGQREAARPYLERALEISERVLGPDHPSTAISYWWMGTILVSEENLAEAAQYLHQAVAVFASKLGDEHPDTQGARRSLEAIERKGGGGGE